jgi:hypothetical protein
MGCFRRDRQRLRRAESVYWRSTLPGDYNGDGAVNYQDLLILASSYGKASGQAGYDVRADYDGDGVVNYAELLLLAQNYGA